MAPRKISPMILKCDTVIVIFKKATTDTATVLYNNKECKVNQRYIFGTIGHLTEGEEVRVEKNFLE